MPEAVGRTVPEILRVEEMSISFSTSKSNPYTLLVQCSGAGPEAVDVGELILRTRKPETWPHSVLIPLRGGVARTILKRSPGGEDRDSACAGPRQHPPYLCSAGVQTLELQSCGPRDAGSS